MEYFNFELAKILQDNQFQGWNEAEIKYIFLQITNGVDVLHNLSLAHRDLKPSNILINGYGRIKLVDFGSCRKIIMICFILQRQ